ncbi:hypothetical protein DFH28DRAFT_1125067 [Melampsora americana]|nr:hypothetical protein DFH28DRAFT_1125067 [Melampsora americana]
MSNPCHVLMLVITATYVQQFVGLNENFEHLEVTPAGWSQAIDVGVKTWTDEKAKK